MKYIVVFLFFIIFSIEFISQKDTNSFWCNEIKVKTNAIQENNYLFPDGYKIVYIKLDSIIDSLNLKKEAPNLRIVVNLELDSLGRVKNFDFSRTKTLSRTSYKNEILFDEIKKMILAYERLNLMFLITPEGEIKGYLDNVSLVIKFCENSKAYMALLYDYAFTENPISRGHNTCPNH
jgi:hypothetical protein